MADKFCDPTLASGLNDGTSVANAWQDLDAIMTGTLPGGAINAGDVIHIRSDDGSGNDNAVNVTGTMVSRGTIDQPIEWRVDDGTYWSNPAVFTIQINSGTNLTTNTFNILNGQDKTRARIRQTETFGNRSGFIRINNGWLSIKNMSIDCTPVSGTRSITFDRSGGEAGVQELLFEGCTLGPFSTGTGNPLFDSGGARSYDLPVTLRNCVIDLNSIAYTNVFQTMNSEAFQDAILHSCEFVNVVQGANLCSDGRIAMRNTKVGLLNLSPDIGASSSIRGQRVIAGDIGCVFGDFSYSTYSGTIDWRAGQNYPVLNAILPGTANTGWSWRVFPNITVDGFSVNQPFILTPTQKFYTSATSTRTLGVEILLNTSFGTPTDAQIWVDFYYVDSSGNARIETTKGTGTNLATSTAGWDTTVYGANSYSKFKMELTTAQSIQSESLIEAVVHMGVRGTASTDFMFFDPEITIV